MYRDFRDISVIDCLYTRCLWCCSEPLCTWGGSELRRVSMLIEKHSSCPSHQQELSSAFSWTVLQDPSLRESLSFVYLTHTNTQTSERAHHHTNPYALSWMCVTMNSRRASTSSNGSGPLKSLCFYPFVKLMFLPLLLPPSICLSSLRCGWVGESCSSQTVHLPYSAKRPESSGRARAKGCSLREIASLHKPAREKGGCLMKRKTQGSIFKQFIRWPVKNELIVLNHLDFSIFLDLQDLWSSSNFLKVQSIELYHSTDCCCSVVFCFILDAWFFGIFQMLYLKL